jgi:hypothetical protein
MRARLGSVGLPRAGAFEPAILSNRPEGASHTVPRRLFCGIGGVAEWLGKGLQNPVHRFNSGPRLERAREGPYNRTTGA